MYKSIVMMVLARSIRDAKSGARELVNGIIEFGRSCGIDQATLAARAKVAPETLSRLKKTGNCRLTTLFALARAAGLRRVELLNTEHQHSAAQICAQKLSASRRLPITTVELLAALTSRKPQNRHCSHLLGFFEELPLAAVHDVILDEALDYGHLFALAASVGAEGETVDWLAEMADDGVAHAA